jgi:hypothetical protein
LGGAVCEKALGDAVDLWVRTPRRTYEFGIGSHVSIFQVVDSTRKKVKRNVTGHAIRVTVRLQLPLWLRRHFFSFEKESFYPFTCSS